MFGKQGDGMGEFSNPKGIAVDTEGHIYVADAIFDSVQIFDKEGRLLLYFGESGQKPGDFWLPSSVFIGETNRIFVSDSYNQRVQVFKFLGGH
jgi:DNA-binding beta-propeller fold protein YncE